MTIIKDGYAGQPFVIKIFSPDEGRDKYQVWTEMFDSTVHSDYEVFGDKITDDKFRTEVLHYATTEELVALRDSINKALKEGLGL